MQAIAQKGFAWKNRMTWKIIYNDNQMIVGLVLPLESSGDRTILPHVMGRDNYQRQGRSR
jgi:hypothetical protein